MMIRMVGGWVFLLVLAHPGSPGQRTVKWLLLLLLLSAHFNAVLFWTHLLTLNSSNLYHKVTPPGKSQQPRFCFWQLLQEFQYKMLSRTEPVWTRCWIRSTSAVYQKTFHSLLEHQQTLWLMGTWYATRCGGKSRRHKASVNGDVVTNTILQQKGGSIKHL